MDLAVGQGELVLWGFVVDLVCKVEEVSGFLLEAGDAQDRVGKEEVELF